MSSTRASRSSANAFTLVELLVVIGIIALLISILLPSLNKARQQANLVKCQSNLRTIGQALFVYEAEHKSMMPMGQIDNIPGNVETQWYWIFALGEVMNKNMLGSDGYVRSLSKVFTDLDTTEGQFGQSRWTNHYTCNPRLFYCPLMSQNGRQNPALDAFGTSLSANRKASDVKQSAKVFVVWDGAQAGNFYYNNEFNTYPVAQGIDAFAFYYTGLCYSDRYGQIDVDLAVWPNQLGETPGSGNGAVDQKLYNNDADQFQGTGSPPWQALRFRHMRNSQLAALCLDGHCETRAVGTVLRRDIYTNTP